MAAPNVWTVGTGKLYATIGAAIAAAGTVSGDCIEVYDTAGHDYPEAVDYGAKALVVRGMLPNQGLSITFNGNAVTLGGGGSPGCFENFRVIKSGAVASTGIQAGFAGAYMSRIRNCIVSGFSLGYGVYTSALKLENCIAYSCTTGFNTTGAVGSNPIHCGAFKCTTGFTTTAANQNYPMACLAAGNVTDYNNTFAAWSMCNVSADLTAPGGGNVTGFLTADFVNYAGNDFRISQAARLTTKARLLGHPLNPVDIADKRRPQDGAFYAGAYHCFPLPTWGPGEVSGIH